MEFWEFLIQKEGDRSWLPLESSTVEILEGRYRMVARSSRVNTPVEIRVIHDALYEDPPKRRIQKRANRTNHDGLIVVMPFTFLQAGSWELVCTGDLMADMLGDTWTYQVKLQVVLSDQELGDGYDWGGDPWAESHAALLAGQASPYTAKSPESQPEPLVSGASSAPSNSMTSEASSGALSETSSEATSEATVDPSPSELAGANPHQETGESHVADSPAPIAGEPVTENPAPEVGQDTAAMSSGASTGESSTHADLAANLADLTPQQIWQNAEASSEQLMAELFAGFESMAVDVVSAEPEDSDTHERPDQLLVSEVAQGLDQDSLVQAVEQDSDQQDSDQSDQSDQSDSFAHDVVATSETASSTVALETSEHEQVNPEFPIADNVDNLQDLWQIHLASSHYVIRQGTGLTLSGQVSGQYPDVEDYDLRWLYLEAMLRNPQTGDVLQKFAHPLDAEHLPCGFALDLEIQGADETHLFLGDLNLVCQPSPEMTPRVLASQSFSVTADLNNLLNAIANEFAESQDLQPPLVFLDQEDANLNLTFLNLIESPEAIATPVQSTGHTVLPPKLYQPDQEKTRSKSIDLPFAHAPGAETAQPASQQELQPESQVAPQEQPEPEPPNAATHEPNLVELPPAVRDLTPDRSSSLSAIAPDLAQSQDLASPDADSPDLASPNLASPDLDSSGSDSPDADSPDVDHTLPLEQAPASQASPPSSEASPLLAESEWELPPEVWQTPISPLLRPSVNPDPVEVSAEAEQSPEDEAFRALNLQERFLSRLNSLASDPELSRLLQRTDPVDAVPAKDAPFDWDDPLVSTEVVVEDEGGFPTEHPATASSVSFMEPSTSDLEEVEELPILPEDQPIPAPQMLLKSGELTAGEMVSIVVKLPDVASRIYVKLWLYDLQNRARLDGPKWLINFLPERNGQLEARSQLMVPFGCREVQFEAIAIEMATQRESHKVILEREVIPPDLPLSSIDHWDELNF